MHIDYLSTVFDPRSHTVLDVGAGDGTYSRQLDQAGANVTGIEIELAMVDRAKTSLPGSISMLLGRAEALPVKDNTQDLACFFFSFHHVPIDVQEKAIREVIRVLKPGGRLHVVEPFPYGSMFEVVRMVEDETCVRTHSHEVMGNLSKGLEFNLLDRKDYTLTREYPDFEIFIDKIVRPNPERSAIYSTVKEKMKETFHRVLEAQNGRKVLHQPCAAYHFELSG